MTEFGVGWLLILVGSILRMWSLYLLAMAGLSSKVDLAITRVPPKGWATTGPYRVMNHPAYTGYCLLIAGLGCLCLGWGGLCLFVPTIPHYTRRAAQEDAMRALEQAQDAR